MPSTGQRRSLAVRAFLTSSKPPQSLRKIHCLRLSTQLTGRGRRCDPRSLDCCSRRVTASAMRCPSGKAQCSHSGAGKTSTIMLMQLIDPRSRRDLFTSSRAQISIMRALSHNNVVEDITWVSATPTLIRELCASSPDDDLEITQRRSRFASSSMDTIGQEDIGLSVGQRQRFCPDACTLLATTPIVILDEPTAHLGAPVKKLFSRG